jgi:hypothetical protein
LKQKCGWARPPNAPSRVIPGSIVECHNTNAFERKSKLIEKNDSYLLLNDWFTTNTDIGTILSFNFARASLHLRAAFAGESGRRPEQLAGKMCPTNQARQVPSWHGRSTVDSRRQGIRLPVSMTNHGRRCASQPTCGRRNPNVSLRTIPTR